MESTSAPAIDHLIWIADRKKTGFRFFQTVNEFQLFFITILHFVDYDPCDFFSIGILKRQ